ncbi:MAG: ubiquinol-cytochrome c reductase iron-sulfur subunit [Hyphomicrobiales bacterium]|nr:ubiquinol-cytochrome c reductase iron-sulfur subunit [Hyphomicrobiales bacterium]OQW84927.1 MAG: ubiquinol-cytochrome c reductase iron-sulfur subunit [Proteobacteria bacterium ST_bin15]
MVETMSAHSGTTRRDFIYLATGAAAAVGSAGAVWPFIAQMNPDASTLALASVEVNIASVKQGQMITVLWRGKPVFIRRRTEAEIKAATDAKLADLSDPETDQKRVQKPEWLILIGVCTHLGCVPLGYQGSYNGWFCPCHGSLYDTSGRVRKGPAQKNLEVPQYSFVTDSLVRIG